MTSETSTVEKRKLPNWLQKVADDSKNTVHSGNRKSKGSGTKRKRTNPNYVEADVKENNAEEYQGISSISSLKVDNETANRKTNDAKSSDSDDMECDCEKYTAPKKLDTKDSQKVRNSDMFDAKTDENPNVDKVENNLKDEKLIVDSNSNILTTAESKCYDSDETDYNSEKELFSPEEESEDKKSVLEPSGKEQSTDTGPGDSEKGLDVPRDDKTQDDSVYDDSGSPNKKPVEEKTVLKEAPSDDPVADSSAENGRKTDSISGTKRVKCTYGALCYRRNVKHKQDFIHPGDPDYVDTDSEDDEDEDKPECKYGASCFRTNPTHRKQFKHSDNKNSTKGSARTRTRRSTRTRSTDPDDPSLNIGKRKRTSSGPKNDYKYDSEDSYEHDDPFINDGSSDDYQPTESSSDTDVSDADDEDIKRTVNEAKRFIKN